MVQIDFLRGISGDYTITVAANLGGTGVDSQTVSPMGAFGSATMTFVGPVDTLFWNQPCCYGADNLRYTTTTTSNVSCP